MSDSAPSAATSLPPPPQSMAAPGTTTNGSGGSHMPPPPLPPVVIPQNNNPIPTAVTSPYTIDASGILSPTTPSGRVSRAAPEPNKRALYVGGLDQRVTEEILKQIFETAGHVQSVKIIPDKSVTVSEMLLFHCHNP
jgi:nucleolysin TIA-1/TIAR